MLDLGPGVGDVKGLIEVGTGRDLVSGEALGAWRWVGLLGLVGLAEARDLRHADEAADALRAADEVTEATVERAAKEVRFAQKGISKVFRHGEFAGKTIDEIAQGLKSGAIHPDQLPIKVIERDGVMYALNNRSLMALRLAGLEPTVIENVTGQEFFERQLTERLLEIGSEVGPDFVPIIRGGP